MSLVTLTKALGWLGITDEVFTITAGNDVLVLTSDKGSANIDVADGTYNGTDAATALQTAMNASTTLTGTGAVTFAVSWSATTRKFTLNAGTGHTIAYTNAGSDAGLTFGFSANATAAQTITSDTPCGDPTADVQYILDWVDGLVKLYCNRTIESTSYKEWIDGTGGPLIWLSDYPVTALNRICIESNTALQVSNSSSDCAYSQVSVTTTGLTLTVVGGTNEHSDTLTFASYTTLTLINTAINELGYGWVSTLIDSDYAAYPSTNLREGYGLQSSHGAKAALDIPSRPTDGYRLDPGMGEVYRSFGWPAGYQNIYCDYTAGYSTIPEVLQNAVCAWIKFLYDKKNEEAFGLSSYNNSGIQKAFEEMPGEVRAVLDAYRKPAIW